MTEPKNSKLSPVSAADVHAAESALMSGRIERRDFMRIALLSGVGVSAASAMAGFAERAYANQLRLGAQLRAQYDYIVCGSGSSGAVVARRLAEDPSVHVLLLEAGGSDEVPSVVDPGQWFTNLGSERDWGFKAEPNPAINNRQMPLSMGKVLGGGSSINVMIWSRGHKNDWDYFASEAGDDRWSYENVLKIYRDIEDYQGAPDADRRGKGGLVYVQDVPDPIAIAPAMLEACAGVGIPTYADQNGEMMEGDGGAAIPNVRFKHGRRLNVFDTYVRPILDRPNITVLTHATVRKLVIEGTTVKGVDFLHGDTPVTLLASREVILSTGARWRQMNVPGEDQYKNKGVAYCPHCDGPLFKGKRVAVIGGGNSGVEAAIDLAGIVAHVTLIEYDSELRADAVLQRKLATLPNVRIVTSALTTEVRGDGEKVTGLSYKDRNSDAHHDVDLEGVFVQIGLVPNTEWLHGAVALTTRGEIEVDHRGETSQPGVFGAGDVTTVPYKQIVVAMGEGSKAGLAAFDYMIRTVPAEEAVEAA